MSQKIIIGCLLSSFITISTHSYAVNHTVSLGYSQGNIKDFKSIRGINAQYRYEWDKPVSIIGAFTYMKGEERYSFQDVFSEYNGKADLKYYSLLAGPAYRISEYISLYALVGLAHTKLEHHMYNSTDLARHSETYQGNMTSVAYGAGIAINPIENISINIGYEGTHIKYHDSVSINGFNIGMGYRF